jgi:hypothetical protein
MAINLEPQPLANRIPVTIVFRLLYRMFSIPSDLALHKFMLPLFQAVHVPSCTQAHITLH